MARKYHDGDWLRERYHDREMTTGEIAAEVGVSKETIRNWLHRNDIELRSKGGRKGHSRPNVDKPAEDTLNELYHEEGLTAEEIANQYGVVEQTVFNWMGDYDIESRGSGTRQGTVITSMADPRLEDKEWLKTRYVDRKWSMLDIADEIGCTTPSVGYKLDTFGIETRTEDSFADWGGSDTEFQRDPDWSEKRQKRIESDNRECQDCGIPEEEYYRSLDVHHLKAKDKFVNEEGEVDWEAANAQENLVTLCQFCHMHRHVGNGG